MDKDTKRLFTRFLAVITASVLAGVLLLSLLVFTDAAEPPQAPVTPLPPLEISTQAIRPILFTFQDSVITNTSGSRMDVTQLEKVVVQVEGIGSATVTFSGTVDGSTWYAVEAINRNSGAKSTSTTSDGIFEIATGFAELRTPISSWASGTIIVTAIGKDSGVASPADIEVSDITTGTVSVDDGGNVLSVDDAAGSLSVDDGGNVLSTLPEDADGDQVEIGPNGSLATKRLLLRVDECESITSETVAGSTDVSGIATSTEHRGSGTNSIEFDKTGTTQAYAVISRTISAIDATDWAGHLVDYWLWITDADQGQIDKIYIGLGTDSSNYWYWESDDSDFNDGAWTHITYALGAVSGQVGVGADWSSITYWILYVTLDNTSDTLTNMRLDDITLERSDSVYLRDVYNGGFPQVDINDLSRGTQSNDITVEGVAGEAHLGEVGYSGDWITATMTMAASTYADGDVLADTQEITGAIRVNGGDGFITSLVILDEDDQGGDLDVVFFRSDVSLGTEDSPVSITDADARQIMCTVRILSSDYDDLIASQVAVLSNVGCGVEAVSDDTSVWVGLISRDTKTYTDGGIQLAVFFDQN